jgi:hypothetical protein
LYYKTDQKFDAIVLVFAHFPEKTRQNIHHRVAAMLKPGGAIVLEAFNLQQLENKSGGPNNPGLLYSTKILKEDFSEMEIQQLENKKIQLYEGRLHEGEADVIRLIAKKNA